MESLLAEHTPKNKAMWFYPKVLGFNPSQRWGHSACFSGRLMYVFGGCCGGLHFSDVLCLDLDKMEWNKVTTTGEKPGPRDSHSAVLVGHKMIVFGGTNGFKKVNETHILDLYTKEWIKPKCEGTPPSPRESHTATLVGNERLVIFGGSGEGDANYLNDLHILDLRTMRWSSIEVNGDLPVPRDSHCSLAIGNKVIVYGGDSGDQYHGDVSLLDMETMTWTRLKNQGSSPGVRAGHAAVNIGTKVYIIGGVGDKRYSNDIWVFDIHSCLWTQLDIHGQQPQGRFSHTAVVADTDIVIYGGSCGEDERPLNELLVLQLGANNISGCKVFGSYWNQEKKTILGGGADANTKTPRIGNNMEVLGKWGYGVASEKTQPYQFDSGTSQQKRRRIAATKVWDVESEQEEHSLSLSQHSSPSQSDQEQAPGQKPNSSSVMDSQRYHRVKLVNKIPSTCQLDNFVSNKRFLKKWTPLIQQDLHVMDHQPKQEQYLHVDDDKKGTRHQALEPKPASRGYTQQLIGAEVRGKVDGAFDSGFLMTAVVNGRLFRGVLFAPGAGVAEPNCSLPCLFPSTQPLMNSNHVDNARDSEKVTNYSRSESCYGLRQPLHALPSPITKGAAIVSLPEEHKIRSDLQGLALTLGGPTSGNHV
ncbi:Galactose oxidase/kelch repeat superfamily protein [Trifolium repens]|nr:Galactose oxidase/kelch repeat superfamily protein [Trifolium repens]